MVSAITSGLPGQYPVVICYPDIFMRDHWEQITRQPWWASQSPDLEDRTKAVEDLTQKLDLDWISCGLSPSRSWRRTHGLEIDGNRAYLLDIVEGKKTELVRPPLGGQHIKMLGEALIKDQSDVCDLIKPVHAEDLRREGATDYIRLLGSRAGWDRFLVASLGSPYWKALSQCFGFREMMVGLRRRPRLIHAALERILDGCKELVKTYGQAGVHGIWIEECLASASEISSSQYEEFVLPYNRELVARIRSAGMKSIYYPCGDPGDRIELLIDTGTDCLSLEESKKGFSIDLARIDRIVDGRACLFGNLSSIGVLEKGTPDQLRTEIRLQISTAERHGRFVMSLGSPVTPRTSVARVAQYVRMSREESA